MATAGAASAVLALLFPLRPLLRLGAASLLLERVVAGCAVLLARFRSYDAAAAEADSGPRYKRLGRSGPTATAPAPPGCPRCRETDEDAGDAEAPRRHRLTVRCLKSGLAFLPAALRQNRPQHYYTSLSSASPEPGDHMPSPRRSTRKQGRGALTAGYRGSARRDAADEELLLLPGDVALEEALAAAGATPAVAMPDAATERPNGRGALEGDAKENVTCTISCESVSSYESETETESEEEEDVEEEDRASSTDIDAVVAEYKEKIQVATVFSGPAPGTTRWLSSEETFHQAALVLLAALVCATALAAFAVFFPLQRALVCGNLAAAVGGAVLFRLPRAPPASARCPHRLLPLAPWLPACAVTLDLVLCANTLQSGCWAALLAWVLCGLVLVARQKRVFSRGEGCCRRRGRGGGLGCNGGGGGGGRLERIRLHAPPRHSTRCTLVPSHRHLPDDRARRLTQVDTILISR